ncbi:OmpA family protein [Microbacterium marinilacus]|uniref:OmpA-like domain-containing protein n=1 Tax=Microbacterium marinilacus TaxID=415209 RepID=A0ABP7BG77_9MICO|nr:OmpA family protein [Microbacterium marinilacus]MBY0690144.1 OmpA family protein [Microbacterium marinilacus]
MTRLTVAAAAAAALVLLGGAAHADTSDDVLDSEITAEMIAASTIDLDPAASTVEAEQTVEENEHRTVRLTSDLLFAFDSADLTDAASAAIADLADEIPDGAAVAVDGHTDSIGDDAYNDDLSQRRADAVADVLRDARPDVQLTVTGHGESELLVQEGKGDQSVNRRVEISYDTAS